MEANRRQNGPPMPALLGGLVAVLTAAFLALSFPAGAGHPAPDSHTGSPGSPATGTRSVGSEEALHTLATTAARTALRLGGSGGCPPATVQPIIAPEPTEPSGTPAGVAPVGSRPPLRILLCTWRN
jgi:hypothetical protein